MFCSYWQTGNAKGEENEVIEVQSRAKRFRVNCWGKIPSQHAHGTGIFLRLDKTSKIDKSENCLASCNITRGGWLSYMKWSKQSPNSIIEFLTQNVRFHVKIHVTKHWMNHYNKIMVASSMLCKVPPNLIYSHLSNNRGGWNKCGGSAKVAKSIYVEVGISKRGGWNFLEKTST